MELTDPPGFELVLLRDEYDITGSTLAEMRAVIELVGPSRGGRRFAAYTAWALRWSYKNARAERGWRVASVEIVTEVTRTLPRWSALPSTREGVAASWDRYLAALELHEHGHVVIAATAGRALYDALTALPECPTRASLDAMARATAARVSDRHRFDEREYDRVTDHGATQGCRLDGSTP